SWFVALTDLTRYPYTTLFRSPHRRRRGGVAARGEPGAVAGLEAAVAARRHVPAGQGPLRRGAAGRAVHPVTRPAEAGAGRGRVPGGGADREGRHGLGGGLGGVLRRVPGRAGRRRVLEAAARHGARPGPGLTR